METNEILKAIKIKKDVVKLCKKAGKIILDAYGKINFDQKTSSRDLVTQYDKKVQEYLESNLSKKYPEINFLAEESDDLGKVDIYHGEFFVIDPIDGTSNFIHNLKHSAISVGYVKDGEVVLGVVYNPYTKDFYSAIKGQGAYLNAENISVNNLSVKNGLVGYGTACYYDDLRQQAKTIHNLVTDNVNDLRRPGTASLDLCYLASGKFCAFYECRLAPWDYCAGMLIIAEAGGKITDFDGKPLSLEKKCPVIAGNPIAYKELFDIISAVK